MPVLKPIRGIRLNKSHPLARGFVGLWLLNEGSGNKIFDLSGNGNAGSLIANTSFVPGKFGSALDFDGTGDYVDFTDITKLNGISALTVSLWLNLASGVSGTLELWDRWSSGSTKFFKLRYEVGTGFRGFFSTNGSNQDGGTFVGTTINTGEWHLASLVYDGTKLSFYLDASKSSSEFSTLSGNLATVSSATVIATNSANKGTNANLTGLIDHVLIHNRALSASEIALLYREPFCTFDRVWRPLKTGGQIVELAGTAAGTSDVTAVLSSIRGLTASTGGFTTVDGSLGIMGESPPEMESTVRHPVENWLREALFNGMTANAFKLGTSLSLGWFWVRVTGCSVLYRGSAEGSMGEIDFTNILAVSGQDEYGGGEISPPSYIPHNNGSTYFYVVRRFNSCGYQERTLAAAVKVSIGSNGELTEPQPNNIFSSKVEQVASNKIRLTWFYCPLEQGSKPVSFNVYYDDRTGQIDYENPLFSSGYKGRKFYSFQSSALEAGGYLFAIRAEDAGGIENISLARLKIQLDTLNPDAIDILRAEAV